MKNLFWVGLTLLCSAFGANAATLVIDVNDILTGATDVNVNGTNYDVEFVIGCTEAYGTCDSSGDMPFTTYSAAAAASDALLGQVLIGVYDLAPARVFGCPDGPSNGAPYNCRIYQIFGFAPYTWGLEARGVITQNRSLDFSGPDFGDETLYTDSDVVFTDPNPYAQLEARTYARWTLSDAGAGVSEVPLSPSAAFLLFGIAGLVGLVRRRKH